jgi:hypothetical protein
LASFSEFYLPERMTPGRRSFTFLGAAEDALNVGDRQFA